MCFFVLFGIVPKEKVIGQEIGYCPICGQDTLMQKIERRMWFMLFFLPILPVSGKQIISRCTRCGLEEDRSSSQTIYYPDYQYQGNYKPRKCTNCGAEAPDYANYCQFCGHKLP